MDWIGSGGCGLIDLVLEGEGTKVGWACAGGYSRLPGTEGSGEVGGVPGESGRGG